jgi:hypothetical protein
LLNNFRKLSFLENKFVETVETLAGVVICGEGRVAGLVER